MPESSLRMDWDCILSHLFVTLNKIISRKNTEYPFSIYSGMSKVKLSSLQLWNKHQNVILRWTFCNLRHTHCISFGSEYKAINQCAVMFSLCSSQQHRDEQEADHGFGGPEHPDQLTVFRGHGRQSLRSGVRLLGQEFPCLLLRNW